MFDERHGLPSASETERLALCRASFLRAQNQPDTTSDIAQAGTRIHEAVETGDRTGLNIAEERLAEDCVQLAFIVHDEAGFSGVECETILEHRFWLNNEDGKRMFSGKPDFVGIDGKRALVIDYKTGYLETIEASRNLQLRALAVLVAENHGVDDISVAIVQPNLSPGYSIARYTSKDLEVAKSQLLKLLDEVNDEDAVANPGEKQCRYCKAKPVCKEAQEASFSVIKTDLTELDERRLPDLLEKCDLADRVISAIRSAALGVVQSGGTVDGWELPNPGKSRAFVSTYAVFSALGDTIPREAFANACDVKLNKLEQAWLDATDENETKSSRLAELRRRLEGVSVYTEKKVRKLRKAKA